jgi:RHS repeat-associated protein
MGTDAETKSFTYDANGNMASDGRKGLELSWNVLNLVDCAAMHGSSLKYAWLSDGTKVSAKADDGSGNGVQKRYLGSFVLTSNTEHSADKATEVESIAWDEGRIFLDVPVAMDDPVDPFTFPGELEPVMDSVIVDSTSVFFGYRDCWFAGDHLGNVRSVIDITPNLIAPQVLEQSNYLPYGTRIQDQCFASAMADNRWRYAGKEEQDFTPFSTLNLSLLDFGARMYDPYTARWISVDKMAHHTQSYSPYAYCGVNPVNLYDPDGDIAHIAIGIAVGAVVGAAIEGGIAAYHGKSKSEVLGAMARGAIEGGVIAATISTGGALSLAASVAKGAAIGAASSAAGSVAEQAISNESVNGSTVAKEALLGAATGAVGGAISSGLNKASSAIEHTIEAKYASSSVQGKIRNEIKREVRNEGKKVSGSTLNQMEKERVKNRQEAEKAFVDFVKGTVDFSSQKNYNSFIEEELQY